MSTAREIIAESTIARIVRRDGVAKQRLYQGVAPLVGFALDSSTEEMTAPEFAAASLKELKRRGYISAGLKTPDDPVAALTCFLSGRRQVADIAAGRYSAMDASGSPSFIDKYLSSGK